MCSEDDVSLNIRRNLSLLLKSEVNSRDSQNASSEEEEDFFMPDELDLELKHAKSSFGSSMKSDGGDECTSVC